MLLFLLLHTLGRRTDKFSFYAAVEAAVNVGQTGTQINTCGLIVVPILCTNNQDNEVTVTPTPVATQDIDVTGTQNIDQANTCDDDDLGTPDTEI